MKKIEPVHVEVVMLILISSNLIHSILIFHLCIFSRSLNVGLQVETNEFAELNFEKSKIIYFKSENTRKV